MLVRLMFGHQAGDVIDAQPLEARAMLADGRAVVPDMMPTAAPVNPVAVDLNDVDRRVDRGKPRHRRHATR
jgi:hypothetical protein